MCLYVYFYDSVLVSSATVHLVRWCLVSYLATCKSEFVEAHTTTTQNLWHKNRTKKPKHNFKKHKKIHIKFICSFVCFFLSLLADVSSLKGWNLNQNISTRIYAVNVCVWAEHGKRAEYKIFIWKHIFFTLSPFYVFLGNEICVWLLILKVVVTRHPKKITHTLSKSTSKCFLHRLYRV